MMYILIHLWKKINTLKGKILGNRNNRKIDLSIDLTLVRYMKGIGVPENYVF